MGIWWLGLGGFGGLGGFDGCGPGFRAVGRSGCPLARALVSSETQDTTVPK